MNLFTARYVLDLLYMSHPSALLWEQPGGNLQVDMD
jgi:hypothetical protein